MSRFDDYFIEEKDVKVKWLKIHEEQRSIDEKLVNDLVGEYGSDGFREAKDTVLDVTFRYEAAIAILEDPNLVAWMTLLNVKRTQQEATFGDKLRALKKHTKGSGAAIESINHRDRHHRHAKGAYRRFPLLETVPGRLQNTYTLCRGWYIDTHPDDPPLQTLWFHHSGHVVEQRRIQGRLGSHFIVMNMQVIQPSMVVERSTLTVDKKLYLLARIPNVLLEGRLQLEEPEIKRSTQYLCLILCLHHHPFLGVSEEMAKDVRLVAMVPKGGGPECNDVHVRLEIDLYQISRLETTKVAPDHQSCFGMRPTRDMRAKTKDEDEVGSKSLDGEVIVI
ncbi:hypothetical protein FRC14_007957 [Serendipita sp. 396]|nr:hypothetical protein FRC14_007957 [Serendipita sp. 396]KAG8783787.1 hypothetical protein FRC15_004547 [Serendipita sp. 397]KAG8793334.1 hypothetical protein FRC16_011006 [Serendipita sp. 398]KAG8867686.1 hypothetical protein FRC20_005147 [Serendipita sp. 405]